MPDLGALKVWEACRSFMGIVFLLTVVILERREGTCLLEDWEHTAAHGSPFPLR